MNGNKETPLLLVTPNGVMQLIEESFNSLLSSSIKNSNISIITRIGPGLNGKEIQERGLWYKRVLNQDIDKDKEGDLTHSVILIDCIGFDYDNDPNLSLRLFLLCYVMSSVIIYYDSYATANFNPTVNANSGAIESKSNPMSQPQSQHQAEESFASLLKHLRKTIINKGGLSPILLYISLCSNITINTVDPIQGVHSDNNTNDLYLINELHHINNDNTIIHDLFSKAIRIRTSLPLQLLNSALDFTQLISIVKATPSSQSLILNIDSIQALLQLYSSQFNTKDIDINIDINTDIIDINKQLNCIRYSMLANQCNELTSESSSSSYLYYNKNGERKMRNTYKFITKLICIFLHSRPMTMILPEKEQRDCMFKYFNQIVKQDKEVRLALLHKAIDNVILNSQFNDNDNGNGNDSDIIPQCIESLTKDIIALFSFIPLLSKKKKLYHILCNSFNSKMKHILNHFKRQDAEMQRLREENEMNIREIYSKGMNKISDLNQIINDRKAELTLQSNQHQRIIDQLKETISIERKANEELKKSLKMSNDAIQVLSEESNEKVLLENNQAKLIDIIKLLLEGNRNMKDVNRVINSLDYYIREQILNRRP